MADTQNAKRLDDYVRTRPKQLILFEQLASEDPALSNTIDLYDVLPKYWWGNVKRINGTFLNQIERTFEYKGTTYRVRISPARLRTAAGAEKEYYPSQREELVEDALRKLASNRGRSEFLDELTGLVFSINELQQELKRLGRGYNHSEIREALQILANTKMELESADGSVVVHSSLLETLGLSTFADVRREGKNARCFVRFNVLVTRSVKSGTFRQIDYETCMSYSSVLARCLHKRLAITFVQASVTERFGILMSTVIRDAGIELKEKRLQLRAVREALEEMVQKGVLLGYSVEKRLVPKSNKIDDVLFTLTPSAKFSRLAKLSNSAQRSLRGEPRTLAAGRGASTTPDPATRPPR